MTALSPARRFACAILREADAGGGYAREIGERLRDRPEDPRDAAFGLRLALGVTATVGCLDELLDQYLTKPRAVSPAVRRALRLAAFELVYLDATPAVAVSQGVELVRSQARAAAGLANAVLRRVATARGPYLAADDVPPADRPRASLARRAGLPVWLMRQIEASCGFEAAAGLGACALEPAPIFTHLAAGAGEGLVPGCARPEDPAALIATGVFDRAEMVASDESAQLIATAATAPGSCLEIGAGRGTKTFVMCAQARRAGFAARRHVAAELSAERTARNRERLERAGLDAGVTWVTGDCRDLDRVLVEVDQAARGPVRFDTVLVDAPCSGTGTMRRHPEIPWRLAPDEVERALPELQQALLSAAAARVASGGQLLYATCSVLSSENVQVVQAFLESSAGRDFALAPVSEAPIFALAPYARARAYAHERETSAGCIATVPVPGRADGHFCARLVRAAS